MPPGAEILSCGVGETDMLLSAITEPVDAQGHPFIIVNNLLHHYNFGVIRVVDFIPSATSCGVLARHEDGDLIEAAGQQARTPLSPVVNGVAINVGPEHVIIVAN